MAGDPATRTARGESGTRGVKRVGFALLALTASAAADSKTKELAQGYTKELGACHTRADGVTKVTNGAQALVDGGDAQYAPDLDQLKASLAQVQAYCGELDATLQLIADPSASYKALEHQLDEHDNKIRKLRQSSKRALDGLAPVIGKLIPVINARAGTADAPVKKTPIKFASGRSIDAPALPGTWKVSGSATNDIVEYTEGKASATISVRAVEGTCADRKKELAKSAVDATSPAKLVWYVAYEKDTRRIHTGCRTSKTGSLVATLDEPVVAAWPALEPVLIAMLATRDDK
jgi:hypothetical protein